MLRIAQIVNNKAHWIFKDHEMPNFPPDTDGNPTILVNITNLPKVREGWDYCPKTGTFSGKEIEEHCPEDKECTIITNEDLMEINLLQLMIALENNSALNNRNIPNEEEDMYDSEEKPSQANISSVIIEGWATLVFRDRITIDYVPENYREHVKQKLEIMELNNR